MAHTKTADAELPDLKAFSRDQLSRHLAGLAVAVNGAGIPRSIPALTKRAALLRVLTSCQNQLHGNDSAPTRPLVNITVLGNMRQTGPAVTIDTPGMGSMLSPEPSREEQAGRGPLLIKDIKDTPSQIIPPETPVKGEVTPEAAEASRRLASRKPKVRKDREPGGLERRKQEARLKVLASRGKFDPQDGSYLV